MSIKSLVIRRIGEAEEMGLSSSQGRLLMLTSRLSDIQLQETIISQRQNQLAWESEAVAREYNEATSNYKLEIKIPDPENEDSFEKEYMTYENMTQLGYLPSNAEGQIYLKKDENGNWIIPQDVNGNPLLSVDTTTGKATVGSKQYDVLDGSMYLANDEIIQNLIMNNAMFLIDTKTSSEPFSITNLQSDKNIEYVLDTSDDAAAQSKYEYESASISRQENRLDLELGQLETQHEAVLKEYDSVKEVISNNVDRTFNLFSNG